jgi:hypothetical protein
MRLLFSRLVLHCARHLYLLIQSSSACCVDTQVLGKIVCVSRQYFEHICLRKSSEFRVSTSMRHVIAQCCCCLKVHRFNCLPHVLKIRGIGIESLVSGSPYGPTPQCSIRIDAFRPTPSKPTLSEPSGSMPSSPWSRHLQNQLHPNRHPTPSEPTEYGTYCVVVPVQYPYTCTVRYVLQSQYSTYVYVSVQPIPGTTTYVVRYHKVRT